MIGTSDNIEKHRRRKSPQPPLLKIFSLPSDLIIHVLSYGITLKDISRLDLVITNKARESFLDCLKDENMTFAGINRISCANDNETKAKNYSYLNWIALRGISVQQLDFAHLDIGRTLFNTLLKRCKHLQHISLCRCTNGTNTSFDYEIVKLSECCTEITYINIGFLNVTDAAMVQLIKRNKGLKQLRAFRSTISNDTVFSLGENYSNLNTLDFGYIRVTQDALFYLVSHNPNLLHLNIANMSFHQNISYDDRHQSYTDIIDKMLVKDYDFIIEVLAKHCTKLVTLDVSNCHYLRLESVMRLLKNCSQLRSLNVTDCMQINAFGSAMNRAMCLDHFARHFPLLRVYL